MFLIYPNNSVFAQISTTVNIETGGFNPSSITIPQGSTITWENTASFAVTVTSGIPAHGPDGEFDSGIITPNSSFSHTFDEAGDFFYYDSLHPWISGAVEVVPTPSSPPPSPPPSGPIECETDGDLVSGGNLSVEIISTAPTAGDAMQINIQFKDTSSGALVSGINYALNATQGGSLVLTNSSNSVIGITNLSTNTLSSSNTVNIDLVLDGVGPTANSDIWTSPLDETISFQVEPTLSASTCTTTTSTNLKNDILQDIDTITSSVLGSDPKDNMMPQANDLVDVFAKINAIKNTATKNSLSKMTENVIVSYLIASTPGGIHDDSVIENDSLKCNNHYVKAVYSSPREMNIVLSSSTNVGRVAVTKSPVSIDGTCIPFVIKGAQMLSSQFTTDEKTLVFNIHPTTGGDFWVSFSNSVLGINKHDGNTLSVKLNDVPTNEAQILITDTISILKVPFSKSINQIDISVKEVDGDCRTRQVVFTSLQGIRHIDYCVYLEVVYKTVQHSATTTTSTPSLTNDFNFVPRMSSLIHVPP